MKQLLVLRHAKSSWDNPELADIERPLAGRGLRNAVRMGQALNARGVKADRVLCSDAQRTRETWTLLAPEWLGDQFPPIEYSRRLYMASPEKLLRLCRETEGDVQRLMLLGHNPGLQELCIRLCGADTAPELLAQLKSKLPTAAFVLLSFPTDSWKTLEEGMGHLEMFLRPRDLD